jgi:hypothetical protein
MKLDFAPNPEWNVIVAGVPRAERHQRPALDPTQNASSAAPRIQTVYSRARWRDVRPKFLWKSAACSRGWPGRTSSAVCPESAGSFLTLGLIVSQATVSPYSSMSDRRQGQSWQTFRSYAGDHFCIMRGRHQGCCRAGTKLFAWASLSRHIAQTCRRITDSSREAVR